ncbi:COX15/CtaA family protein [Sediminicola sp. 1XM1-17]|uniref:COX15/CtaA family protein n=1 Tax=Sediminicola sp. 1XM1-17 TaxID=3127702 RepID=UPI00307832E9
MQHSFRKIAKTALILVYLVIVAGTVVRMTGSGMGCPDWPKCFGYYIPPTDSADLQFQPNKVFKKGQVIIVDESLKVAKADFETGGTYKEENWEAYTKHDYAIFNPLHTWIEFINRLFGALAGLATLVLAVLSFSYWKKNKLIPNLSWLVVFGMGFQAWLGATVVYSVLLPSKITMHMVMALVIVAALLYIIHISEHKIKDNKPDKSLTTLLALALGVTMVQIIMGTQVRQFVDEQIDVHGEYAKSLWLQDPTLIFYVHRSFSILVILLNVLIVYRISKLRLGYPKMVWVIALIFLEVLSGILMVYIDFPFGSQPVHLMLAALLFGAQFYLVLEAVKAGKTLKTL